MHEKQIIFRPYQEKDYSQCEILVNAAWSFDTIFQPQALADLAKRIYTQGSVLASNYQRVVEVDSQVVGFIFGLNERAAKPKKRILFQLSLLWRLFRIQCPDPLAKKNLLAAIQTHEKNRSQLVKRGRSEVVLFVVAKQFQGMGFGKQLWGDLKSHCTKSGVESIVVETNKLGAASFYEQVGFRHLADFDSPLHEYASKGGQACMYEYLCK